MSAKKQLPPKIKPGQDVLVLPSPPAAAAAAAQTVAREFTVLVAVDISSSMSFQAEIRWKALVKVLQALRTSLDDCRGVYVVMYGPSSASFRQTPRMPGLLATAMPHLRHRSSEDPLEQQRINEDMMRQQCIPLDVFVGFLEEFTCTDFVNCNSTYSKYLEASIASFKKRGISPDLLVVLGDGDINIDFAAGQDSQEEIWRCLSAEFPRSLFVLFCNGENDVSIARVKTAMASLALAPVATNVFAPIHIVDAKTVAENPENELVSNAKDAILQAIERAREFPVPADYCPLDCICVHRGASNTAIRDALLSMRKSGKHPHIVGALEKYCERMVKVVTGAKIRIEEPSLFAALSVISGSVQDLANATRDPNIGTAAQRNEARMRAALEAASQSASQPRPTQQSPATWASVFPAAHLVSAPSHAPQCTLRLVVVPSSDAAIAMNTIGPLIASLGTSGLPRDIVGTDIGAVLTIASRGAASTDLNRAVFALIQLGIGELDPDTHNALVRFVRKHSVELIDAMVVRFGAEYRIADVFAVPELFALRHFPLLCPPTKELADKARVIAGVREAAITITHGKPAFEQLRLAAVAARQRTSRDLFASVPIRSLILLQFDFCLGPDDRFPNVLVALKLSPDHVLLLYPEQPLPDTAYVTRRRGREFSVPPTSPFAGFVVQVMVHHDCRATAFDQLVNSVIYGYQPTDLPPSMSREELKDALERQLRGSPLAAAAVRINRLYHSPERNTTTAETMLGIYRQQVQWLPPPQPAPGQLPPLQWPSPLLQAFDAGYPLSGRALRELRPLSYFTPPSNFAGISSFYDPATWPACLQGVLRKHMMLLRYIKRRPAAAARSQAAFTEASAETAAEEAEPDACYICLEDFPPAPVCSAPGCGVCEICATSFCTQCRYRAHSACIEQWRRMSSTCGMCRSPLKPF